jgi:hypothetical protein
METAGEGKMSWRLLDKNGKCVAVAKTDPVTWPNRRHRNIIEKLVKNKYPFSWVDLALGKKSV